MIRRPLPWAFSKRRRGCASVRLTDLLKQLDIAAGQWTKQTAISPHGRSLIGLDQSTMVVD